jgi:desulfoferrodoxin (superoxide reductase-like protein)
MPQHDQIASQHHVNFISLKLHRDIVACQDVLIDLHHYCKLKWSTPMDSTQQALSTCAAISGLCPLGHGQYQSSSFSSVGTP